MAETCSQKGTEKRERMEPRCRTNYIIVHCKSLQTVLDPLLTGMRRAIALSQGPEAAFIGANEDRIWHNARNWANYLAELVLIHCHHPRPITRLSWGQTGKLNGDTLDHGPSSFRPLDVHLCHCSVCDTDLGFLFWPSGASTNYQISLFELFIEEPGK